MCRLAFGRHLKNGRLLRDSLTGGPCSFLPEPFWLVSTTKAYSGIGAGVVMESIFGTGVFRRSGACQHLGLANYFAVALRGHEFVRNRRRDEVRIVLLLRPKPTLFESCHSFLRFTFWR